MKKSMQFCHDFDLTKAFLSYQCMGIKEIKLESAWFFSPDEKKHAVFPSF
jgi:hypothetical protein